MKKILSILLIFVFSTSVLSQESAFDKDNKIATEIFNTLNVKKIKKAFLEIIALDDFAIDSSWAKYPDPYDWDERTDLQRELEETWRLKWYKKQKWWKKIKEDKQIGYYIRSKIGSFGLKQGWDTTLYVKKGKVLTPPKF